MSGDVPLEKLGNFVYLQLESCNLVNTFRRKVKKGDEKNNSSVSRTAVAICVYH